MAFISGQGSNSILKGIITDEKGMPLAGAGVAIDGTYLGISADDEGRFEFKSLKDGRYTVIASFIGYETQRETVDLNGDTEISIVLPSSVINIGEVLVQATRADEHSPLAYSVIDREVLRKTNTVQDIPFLLSLTPSIVETSEAGNGVGYTSLRVRGTDANRINVTIDGIPLNDAESQTVYWVDLPDLASSTDNIQIQRGVGASTHGAGAFGATVSIQTINPENEPTVDFNTSYGSFNTLKNVISASTGLINDKFAFNMRYSDVKSDGYIDRTGSDHRSAFMTGMYKTGRSRLKANLILGEEHTGIGWSGVPLDSLKTNRTYNPAGEYTDDAGSLKYYDNESDNFNQDHYQLLYSFSSGANLSMNAALFYTRGKGYYEEYKEDREYEDYGLNAVSIGSETITSTDLIRRKWNDNHFYGMIYSLNLTKDRTEFVGGLGMNQFLGDHYGTLIWMRDAGTTEKDHQWYFNKSEKSDFNVFGKVNHDLSDKLKVYADLQYRYINYDMNGPDDDFKDLTQNNKFNFFNPKAGLFYEINSSNDAWVSFSVANREPSRSDFKEAAGDPEALPKPETLYDAEAGYKLRGQRGTLSVNLYGMFYKDQLVPTGQLSDVGYSIMTNVDKSYRLGIEMSAALRVTSFLTWNTNMTLSRNKIENFTEYYTDYNTTDWSSQYLSKEHGLVDIAYSPSQIFTSDFAFEKSIFGIHLVSKYVGKQYFDNTMSEARSIDPYFVNNVRVDVNPVIKGLRGLNIQLAVNNIFNHQYESNAYGGNWYEDGIEKTWAYFFPQAGINYLMKVGIKF